VRFSGVPPNGPPMFAVLPPRAAPFRLDHTLSSEALIVLASAFWTLALNRPFFVQSLRTQSSSTLAQLGLVCALALLLLSLHALLLGLVTTRRTVKPVLALLTLVGALTMHYTQDYGVVVDPSMVRNALHTDAAETAELLSWRLLLDLALYGALPLALLMSVRVKRRPWPQCWHARALLLAAALGLLVLVLLWQFQPLASIARNHRTVRYLATPANTLWSLGSVLAADARGAAKPRQPIGLDAAPGPSWATQTRPRLVVLVVGETARAANWGLSGYARQTTPALARLQPLNFTDVAACGTSTEVSVPCMFAPVGRRAYDEPRIHGSESLLHVAARAGVAVHWRDNQSGCKGVCDGLSNETLRAANAPGLCQGGRCWDEGLLRGLDDRLTALRGTHGNQLLVLHMLGNHGPSYFKRYPAAFERFVPACRNDDLATCTRQQIVNAYDNALLYTDHVLATLIGILAHHAADVDAAMLFVSDHGESLGEKGLFLHGVPHVIAPREQTQVPMVMWWSDGFARQAGLDGSCMHQRATQPAQHDHLFHSLLGLLDVRTTLYAPQLDLTHGCRATVHAP
jgi:lipid A ethanolaminephosphotransferase